MLLFFCYLVDKQTTDQSKNKNTILFVFNMLRKIKVILGRNKGTESLNATLCDYTESHYSDPLWSFAAGAAIYFRENDLIFF